MFKLLVKPLYRGFIGSLNINQNREGNKMKEYYQNIDKLALYPVNGLTVKVIITDVKSSYGSVCYQITPVDGIGSIWVNVSSINIIE